MKRKEKTLKMVLYENIYIGQHVEVFCGREIYRGRVKYKGSLATKRGDWVGVALEKSVGENDGMLFGRRYFQCREKHGIFVRADKIRFIPSVRCLFDQYHKIADSSYIEESLFHMPYTVPEVKNGPYDPVIVSSDKFLTAHSSLGDSPKSSSFWQRPPQHHLHHSVGNHIPAVTMLRPNTAMASFRYRSRPVHMQYSIDDSFASKPSIPKIHMPYSALVRQVQRGWHNSHYVREMSVPTGRDSMKFGQWNDISD